LFSSVPSLINLLSLFTILSFVLSSVPSVPLLSSLGIPYLCSLVPLCASPVPLLSLWRPILGYLQSFFFFFSPSP
jgi:hypothetical protein